MKKILKKMYDLVPFKKGMYQVLRAVCIPPQNIYKHLHFKAVMNIKVDKNTHFKMKHYGYEVENDIFWAGIGNGWEKESINLWISLCKNSQTIIDVGANTGIYALIARSLNPTANVYAFEPVKRVYEKLIHNNALNNYNIACFETALSDSDGTATIYDTNAEHTYSVTVNKNLNTSELDAFETQIQTIKLSTFIANEKLANIDLMKIDVESHEPEVLEGMEKHLESMRPTMLIEILNNEIGERVQHILKNMDYLYFRVTNAGIIRTSNISIDGNYCNYLICNKKIAISLGLNSEGNL